MRSSPSSYASGKLTVRSLLSVTSFSGTGPSQAPRASVRKASTSVASTPSVALLPPRGASTLP